jgi:hypothetical protein
VALLLSFRQPDLENFTVDVFSVLFCFVQFCSSMSFLFCPVLFCVVDLPRGRRRYSCHRLLSLHAALQAGANNRRAVSRMVGIALKKIQQPNESDLKEPNTVLTVSDALPCTLSSPNSLVPNTQENCITEMVMYLWQY